MTEKRVIEQTASSEIYNDDWFLKDSPTQDTSKISATNLKAILGADGTQALSKEDNAIAEDYDSTSTYNKDDFAFYENKLYRCLANNTTGTWDGTKWEEFDLPTALITTAHNIETAEFTIGTYYSADDLVLKDGKLYQCVVFHNATEWKSQFWNVVTIDEMLGYLSDSIAPEHNQSTVYAVGDLVMHNKALWRCIQAGAGAFVNANWELVTVADLIAEAGQIDDVQVKTTGDYETVVDNKIAKIDLSNKADKDGMYEELFAGNLVTDMHTADNKPYLYRQSPSASSVSQNIVGGTVAWNQLASFINAEIPSPRAGLTFSTSDNKSCTVNGTSTAATTADGWFYLSENKAFSADKINHVYYFSGAKISGSATDAVQLQFTGNLNSTKGNLSVGDDTILKITSVSSNRRVVFYSANNNTFTDYKFTLVCIDLTQMFGTTIADYIYSLEQATAGSGIAWLKSYGFLTKDYYAYDSGSLQSVNVASRKVVEFNQWDEEWEVGGLNPLNGDTTVENDRIRSKNFNPCIPNANMFYYIPNNKGNLQIVFYDKNKTYLGYYNYSTTHTYETPTNCYFYKFNTGGSYGTTYNNDICINISDASKNGTYEPYTKHTYPLDSDLTLRGIVKKDANNNLYYDGDVYNADGSVKRKYGVVDLGTLSWGYTNGRFYYNPTDAKVYAQTEVANMLCIQYPTSQYNSQADNSISSYAGYIYVRADSYGGDTTAFKIAMNGVYLVYELATPTSETADTYENPQLVGSTEEFIDTRDVPIPVGGERKYYTDLKAKLEELAKIPDVPSTNGTYTLKATRSASGVTYSWVSG